MFNLKNKPREWFRKEPRHGKKAQLFVCGEYRGAALMPLPGCRTSYQSLSWVS